MLAPMPLNVLHISDSDAGGGSARSAFRVHSNLRRLGHVSRMLVGRPQTNDPDVRALKRNVAWRAADRACGAITDPLGLQYVLYPSSFGDRRGPVVSRRRHRPALQPSRKLLQPHRAAISLPPPPGRVAALGHVGVHRVTSRTRMSASAGGQAAARVRTCTSIRPSRATRVRSCGAGRTACTHVRA